jgi:hypothetical protein
MDKVIDQWYASKAGPKEPKGGYRKPYIAAVQEANALPLMAY